MSIAQFIVTYSVCWWLVLFMVLPHGVAPEQKPGVGHAPSAPANPRLRRKFGITTLMAFLPAALVYVVATQARAEDGIYHVGSSECEALEAYQMPDEVMAREGYGAGSKKVAPATMNPSTVLGDMDHVDIPLEIPTGKYLDADEHNVDLSESNAQMGNLRVGMDGKTLLNGQPIHAQEVYGKNCAKKVAGEKR